MEGPFTAGLELGGQTFCFKVHHRELVLGSAGPAHYYWMDGREFRGRKPGPNFRSVVDLWRKVIELGGADQDVDNQVTLVLAEAYPLVSTARSLQDVYVDAHLHASADRTFPVVEVGKKLVRLPPERTYQLPEDEVERLRAVAHARDRARVREELEGLFLGELPTEDDRPRYTEAARHWLGNGVVALKVGGREGLQAYLKTEVNTWMMKLRKRGSQDQVRTFLNLFSYECKVAFYFCYANAWIGLIPWLRENRGLDALSERLLRLWHHQNQPGEEPTGSPGETRDVFCGQVLALHPLSAIALNEPQHLQAIGAWVGHPDYEALHQQGQEGSSAEYWELVATILTAAHEYWHARDHWDATRGEKTIVSGDAVGRHARDDADASVGMLFEDFAAARRIICSDCSGSLEYLEHGLPREGECTVCVTYRCRSCARQIPIPVEETDLSQWITEE
jgi:hypothetical protein